MAYRIFKGTVNEYQKLHYWVAKELGKPKECWDCGIKDADKVYDWANVSGEYKKELSDWRRKCKSCHFKIDRKKEVCNYGHRIEGDNLVMWKGKYPQCRTCKKINSKRFKVRHNLLKKPPKHPIPPVKRKHDD